MNTLMHIHTWFSSINADIGYRTYFPGRIDCLYSNPIYFSASVNCGIPEIKKNIDRQYLQLIQQIAGKVRTMPFLKVFSLQAVLIRNPVTEFLFMI